MQPIVLLFFLIPAIQFSIYCKNAFYQYFLCFLILASLLLQSIFLFPAAKNVIYRCFYRAPITRMFFEKEYVLEQNKFIQEASQYIQPGIKIFMPTQEYGLLLFNARPQYAQYCIPADYLDKLRKEIVRNGFYCIPNPGGKNCP